MSTILLSINPEYVEKIFNGTKKYEYRKIKCKREIEKILIYETTPTMKIVGEASVEKVLEGSLEEIWEKTKNCSGTNFESLLEYYKESKNAVAYKLKDVQKYEEPKSLSEYGIKTAPQSFVYIK